MTVTVLIGVIAFYTYFVIKKQSQNTAQQTAEKAMCKFLADKNDRIKDMILEVVTAEGNKLFEYFTLVKSPDTSNIDKEKEKHYE